MWQAGRPRRRQDKGAAAASCKDKSDAGWRERRGGPAKGKRGWGAPFAIACMCYLPPVDFFTQNPLLITTVRKLDAESDDFDAEQSVAPLRRLPRRPHCDGLGKLL